MKTINYSVCTVFVLLLLSFTACKPVTSNAEKEGVDGAVVEVETPAKPLYDPAKGLHVIAPEMTKMLGDTLGIVMYESIMKPGDSVAWHEHPYHTVYVLEGGTLAVYFEDMKKQIFELPTGLALTQPPAGDAAVNIGETTIRLLTHDIYALDPKE
jgi:quercetin dioxygenase-like cupin family protein